MNRVALNIDLSGWRRTVIFLFTVALIIRAAFVLTLKDGFYFPDSVDYSRAAVSLLEAGEFGETYRRSPLYPVFLAGIYALFGEEIVPVRMVEALLGACLAVVIALIARRIAGDHVGALAGFLWSVYPLGVFVVGLVYPTHVATMLLACALLCMVTPVHQELAPGRVLAGGIILGLGALTVPVVLVTILAITAWILYWQPERRLLLAILFVLGAALSLVPWTVRNYDVYGRLVIIEPRAVQHLPPLDWTDQNRYSADLEQKIGTRLARPRAFARRVLREFGHFWELYPERIRMSQPAIREKIYAKDSRIVRESVFTTSWTSLVTLLSVGPTFLFALIGTGVMCFAKNRRRDLSLLVLTIMSFAMTHSLFYGKMRYRIPVEPYIIILSAYGLWQIWLGLTRRSVRKTAPHAEKPELLVN
jgi:4-amino-4-deoxy-L-arabinose transferase-like glycosyltransferase